MTETNLPGGSAPDTSPLPNEHDALAGEPSEVRRAHAGSAHEDGHGHAHTHSDRADACAPAASARTVAEQLAVILADVKPLAPVRVPLDAARGLVLAEDVLSATDTPPFDNSAMDGYAVTRADLIGASAENPISLPVVADLAAGTAENPHLVPGQVARIMTGAPIPDGADAVVPIEDTDQGTDRVTIVRAPTAAAHVRRAGEDAHAGDRVLGAGSALWPTRVAAAASAGTSSVLVHPAPRVAVISTGSELVTPGSPTRRGQIPDSNSFLLAAAVTEAGGVAIRVGAVPDDDDTLRALLTDLAGTVDVIVLSGGVSVGAYDVVKAVLQPLGTVHFGPVKMQPGKPQGFGRWPATENVPGPLIFALPGNPVSAYVSFEVFVRPALRRLLGHPELHRRTITATVADGWNSPPGRAQYMPVIVTPRTPTDRGPGQVEADASSTGTVHTDADVSPNASSIRSGHTESGRTNAETNARSTGTEDGAEFGAKFEVRPASRGGSGSHLVAGLAQATGLAIVSEDTTHVRGGDLITVMLSS